MKGCMGAAYTAHRNISTSTPHQAGAKTGKFWVMKEVNSCYLGISLCPPRLLIVGATHPWEYTHSTLTFDWVSKMFIYGWIEKFVICYFDSPIWVYKHSTQHTHIWLSDVLLNVSLVGKSHTNRCCSLFMIIAHQKKLVQNVHLWMDWKVCYFYFETIFVNKNRHKAPILQHA